ncbi:MAG: PQQ-binding-like beta-propeller repeat protein [Pseudonocardiales bacterium]|nr:PQQ-binding-like beta-propeller repeat protein [Pseudonocardiales bacterium]
MTTATGPSPRSQDARDRDVPECPYVGLMPFDEESAEYFFGRERESDLIVANLIASRLTLLYAPSGVGKTSVLCAGVLPRLHRINHDSDDELGLSGTAAVYVNVWRDAPLASIAAAIVDAVSPVTGGGTMEETANTPTLGVDWLREVLHESRISTMYLILDQFEDYFLYHSTDRGEEGLTAELGRILSTRNLPVHVLLSIREDALASLDRFKGRVPRLFGNYLRLAHLSRVAAHTAIEGPLARYNLLAPPDRRMSIEAGLIRSLLDQVRTGQVRVAEGRAPEVLALDGPAPDDRGDVETPYLQLVLTRLWNEERASGSSSLRQSTLDELGGAQTIVQTHLDNVMAGLSPAQVDVAAAVFHHLITPSGRKIALAAEDLAEFAELPVSAVQDLLDTLCSGSQRVLRPVPPAVGVAGPPHYEIFHDVMGTAMLSWRRHYVAQRHQGRLVAEREEARATAQTARRQLHLTLLAMGLAVILLATIGVVAYLFRRDAQQRADLAQAATILSYNPVESLRHAVDAYRVNANDDAQEAVLIAASSPRNHIVAGPDGPDGSKPMTVIGMASTPDSRRVVLYDADGNIRVIGDGDNGAGEPERTVSGLRGTVIPVASISTPAVSAAAVAPDASRIALGTDQGMVAVIDTATGQHHEIDSEEHSTPRVIRWVGSATNGLVLVVSNSGVAATYNPETGRQVARFPGVVYDALPLDEQHIVTCGPDKKLPVVTSGPAKKLRVWDACTGTQIAESSPLSVQTLRHSGQFVVGLNFPEKDEREKPSIVEWKWQSGPDAIFRYPIPIDDLNGVRRLVVDEHAHIVIASQDKKVWTYLLAEGSVVRPLPQQIGLVNDVAISPDGRWITTAGADGRVLVWDLGNGQSPTSPAYELSDLHGEVAQVSYPGTGTAVMSLGFDGTVRRWELPPVPRFPGNSGPIVHMDLSRDGRWLATASQDGHVFIIDPQDVAKLPVPTVPTDNPLRVVLFDPTEPHRIVTLGRSDRFSKLWSWDDHSNTGHLKLKYELPLLPRFGYLVSLAISPDGKTLAAGDTNGTIHFWDALTGRLRMDREFPGTGQSADSVAFDPTGDLLAATESGGVRLWKWRTAERLTLLPDATRVTFDPSGQHLASTAGDGAVRIWTRDGKLDRNLLAHGYPSSSPSFSNDGELLAVGTADGLVEVWDVHSGRAVMLDRHHSGPVNSVQFLPGDRSHLLSASDDTTVAQFSCPACSRPQQVIQDAQKWVDTNPETPGER